MAVSPRRILITGAMGFVGCHLRKSATPASGLNLLVTAIIWGTVRTERRLLSKSPTRISNRTSKSSCEQHDRGGIEEGCCRGDSSLEVLGQTAIAAEPFWSAMPSPFGG